MTKVYKQSLIYYTKYNINNTLVIITKIVHNYVHNYIYIY